MKKYIAVAVLLMLGVGLFAQNAQAHVGIRIGIGLPLYVGPGPYYYGYGYPYYYPAPAYVVPPPAVVYQTAPPAVVVRGSSEAVPAPAPLPPPTPLPAPIPGSTQAPAPLPAVASVTPVSANPAVTGLIQQLSDKNDTVRRDAAVELGRLKAQSAVDALVNILGKDASPLARDGAARGLGLIAAPRSMNALIFAAQADNDREVRHSAQFAVEAIRSNLRGN